MRGTGRAGKPRNKPPDLKGKTQKERFIETAKALEVDESGAEFRDALEVIIPSVGSKTEEKND